MSFNKGYIMKKNVLLLESELHYYHILIPFEFIILLYNDFGLKRCTTLTPKRIKYNLERRMKEYGANWIVEVDEKDNDICGLSLRQCPYYLSKAQLEMFSVIAKYIRNGSVLLFRADTTNVSANGKYSGIVFWRIVFKDNNFIIEQVIGDHWKEIDIPELIHLK